MGKFTNSNRITLSVFRIISCFGSFIVHYGQRMQFSGTVRKLTYLGALGVCVFFILTGYFASKKFDDDKELKAIPYYKSRAIRILPLYYFWVLVYIIIYTIFDKVEKDELGLYWLRYVLLLNDKIPATGMWFNIGSTWTIPIFCSFYILAPFLFKISNSYRRALVSFIVGTSLCIVFHIYFPSIIFDESIIANLPFFLTGTLLYNAHKNNKLLVVSIWFIIVNFISHAFVSSGYFLHFSLFFSLIAICLLVDFEKINSRIVKNQKFVNIIKILDKYTYTFYLTHCFIMTCCYWIKLQNRFFVTVFTVFGSIILTYFVYHYIELPIKKYLQNK